jgi:hypothetical protein
MTPRYTKRQFPPYRHRPGSTPHPIRDRDGHSYGRQMPAATIDENSWNTCGSYLFAADLFNNGYYWEAHEELEVLWQSAGPNTTIGRFLQGIIQAAAALIKLETNKPEPAARLAAVAATKLRDPKRPLLGLDGAALAGALEQRIAGENDAPIVIELAL